MFFFLLRIPHSTLPLICSQTEEEPAGPPFYAEAENEGGACAGEKKVGWMHFCLLFHLSLSQFSLCFLLRPRGVTINRRQRRNGGGGGGGGQGTARRRGGGGGGFYGHQEDYRARRRSGGGSDEFSNIEIVFILLRILLTPKACQRDNWIFLKVRIFAKNSNGGAELIRATSSTRILNSLVR